jgi:hypothetical protein
LTNINAFVARLTSLSHSVRAFDFSLYAIWTLRAASEEINDAQPEGLDAAKAWFSYANETLERLSKEEKEFDGKIGRPGDKYKEKEWRGFNGERLEIWKIALQ